QYMLCAGDMDRMSRVSDPSEVRTRPGSKTQLVIRNLISTPTVMLRRDIGQRVAEGKYHSEDYLLWLEIVCAGHLAYRIEEPLAYLYKAPYGEGGLSGQLWTMEKGQLDTYKRVWRAGCVSFASYCLLQAWSGLR